MENEVVTYRLQRAEEAFNVALLTIEKQYWNSAASDLYYTCFYLLLALFAKHNISSTTHSGVKTLFNLHFIKEKKVDEKFGKLVKRLFDKRQKADYADLVELTYDDVMPLLSQVEEFKKVIIELIRQPE
jgi:uncharacterized protein (UPF0332 family)